MGFLETVRTRSSASINLRDDVSAGTNVLLHFAFLGVLAWASGQPLLFPSLGPSAYLLATGERDRAEGAYHVIGGHAIAAITGLVAYLLLADGLVAIDVFASGQPFSSSVGRLASSAILAMVLTTIGMLWTDTNHPAACATTLIVALGLMASVLELVVIVGAVVLLVAFHGVVVERMQDVFGIEPQDPR